MKNNNLKKKIISKVYHEETKKISFAFFTWIFFVVFIFFLMAITYQVILEILIEQKSFNLIEILTEDVDVFRFYFANNLVTFFQEIPKFLLFLFLLSVFILLWLFLMLKKNFKMIKNKLLSIYKFYKKNYGEK
jgi:hypothetical protein